MGATDPLKGRSPRPRTTAVVLLRLCAVPFVLYIFAWSASEFSSVQFDEGATQAAHVLLISHSSIILAFMGGLQQAAATESATEWGKRRLSLLVLYAVSLGMLGLFTICATALRGPSPTEPLLLAAVCIFEPMLETLQPRPMRRRILHDHRQTPMLIAAIALLACAHRSREWPTQAKRAQMATALCMVAGWVALTVLGPRLAGRRRLNAHASSAAFDSVAVGTTNACKLGAVVKCLAEYPEVVRGNEGVRLRAAISAHKVPSGVSEQPMSLDETARGAKNRALAAHAAALAEQSTAAAATTAAGGRRRILGLGIESGLFQLDGATFDVCVVSAFDGQSHHLGLSCAFEIPKPILRHVLGPERCDLSQACNRSGITSDPKLGEHGGLIGLLSSSRLTREAYTLQAISTAVFFAAEAARPWYANP